MCLGLEEVVKCVQESINNKDRNSNSIKNDENVLSYEYPYMCSNCSTDYTTTWRKDKHGNILCEKCHLEFPNLGWFWEGSKLGYGPYDFVCSKCEHVIHSPNENLIDEK